MASDANDLDPRVRLLTRILSELERSGCEFALLHGDPELQPDVASDVDMVFALPPTRVIEPILQRLEEQGELAIVQRLHYDIAHAYYYILRLPGAPLRFLHLDCLCDPLGVNRYRLPTGYLLQGSGRGHYGRHIDTRQESVYLLMKRAIKGRVSPHGLDVLRSRFQNPSSALRSDVERWFGRTAFADVGMLVRAQDPVDAGVPLRQLAARAIRRSRWLHPLRYAAARALDVARKLKRFLRPTGFFVVIVGPDGSGKSTVAAELLPKLERAFRRTWRFHWRPGLLPKLGRTQTQVQSQAPAEVSKYRGWISLARFMYYWADFILGYWFVIYPRKAQSTLIVGERYFPDVVVHPERYGFSVPNWLLRLASATVPAPDLLVVLRGDPHAIFARKGELSPSKIATQLRLYEEETRYWRRSEVLDTEDGASAVCARIADLILEACAARTSIRLQKSAHTAHWRAFPATRGAKVWFSDAASLRNALELYHAYSIPGRLTKYVSGRLPRALNQLLFRGHPDPAIAAQFMRLLRVIRVQLRDESLNVSFSAGTPGPHRKWTAQVSRAGDVVCYVKIARDAPIAALLQHEAEMLRWLRDKGFAANCIPTVVAFAQEGPYTLLFLSPPPGPATQGPPRPTADDIDFLARLADVNAGRTEVGEAFDQIGLEEYLKFVVAHDNAAATTLRQAREFVIDMFRSSGVRTSAAHGDYGAWNTLELTQGGLFVIDWEYGQQCAPALTDLLHRMLMSSYYVFGHSVAGVLDELNSVATDPAFGRVLAQAGVRPTDVPGYILLYLLGQLIHGRQGRHEDNFLLQLIERALRSARAQGRKKILVLAYACEAGRGSEPGVGWSMCQAISREHEVWVLTRENNRVRIEEELARHPNPHLHFAYTDLPKWARFWKKGERGIRTYYYLWQFAAAGAITKLHREIKFDLAHHVTFVNDYFFTALGLTRIPFVWGPIGSPGKRPSGMWQAAWRTVFERREYYIKIFLRSCDPLFWLSMIRARLVIGINDEINRRFPFFWFARHKYLTHTAIGVEEDLLVPAPPPRDRDSFEVFSMGRLIRIKCFDLTIRAFALLSQTCPQARLTIVGDGALRQSLEELADQLGVRDKVHFTGHLPREQAMQAMAKADVFLFPSLEAEGMVVLEALARALPVVSLNYGGPSKMVTPKCGFTVELGPQAAQALAQALSKLATDPALLHAMSVAARDHVSETFIWERRYETIRQWYSRAGMAPPSAPALIQPVAQAGVERD